MLDIIRQKASRLWTAFCKSVCFLWACIGIYAMLLWIIWQGLQQAKTYLTFATLPIIILSALWAFVISLLLSGYRGNYDAINIQVFYISVAFFVGLVVLVGNIRILIFPIAVSIPWSTMVLDEFEFDWYDDWYETYLGSMRRESYLIKRIWTRERMDLYRNRHDFMCHFVSGLVGVYFGIFLVACYCTSSDERFMKCVTSGAIIIAASCMTFVWIQYKKEKAILPIRKAMGGKVSHDAISKLKRMYPRGLDVDRIQFLLHDTLKQRLGNNANITTYGSPIPWYRFDEEKNNTNKIMTLFRVFPGIVSTIYTPDDEGDIPFRLACQYASVEVVKHMVGLDNKLLNIRDSKGNTVMHYACQGNNYKVVKHTYTITISSEL